MQELPEVQEKTSEKVPFHPKYIQATDKRTGSKHALTKNPQGNHFVLWKKSKMSGTGRIVPTIAKRKVSEYELDKYFETYGIEQEFGKPIQK